MKKCTNKKRKPLEFQVGNRVSLKLTLQIWKNINTQKVLRGFNPKYDGAFEVIKKIGAITYRLKLSYTLKIHHSFHITFFKPFLNNQDPTEI